MRFFVASVVAARDMAARADVALRDVARDCGVPLRVVVAARDCVVPLRAGVAVRDTVARAGAAVVPPVRCDTAVRDVTFVVPAPRVVVVVAVPVVFRLRTVVLVFAVPMPAAIRDVAVVDTGAVVVALPRLVDTTAPDVRRVPARATSSPSVAHDGKKGTNIRHVAKKSLIPFILLYVDVSKITESRAREK